MIGRYTISAIIAVGITFGLFFLMQTLIETGRQALVETEESPSIEITRERRDESVQEKERELPDKPKVKEPPDPPETQKTQSLKPGATSVNVGLNTNTDFQGSGVELGGAPSDGDVLPLVRVPPQYPRSALRRGIEGWVILEFDITKEGTVTNAKVVKADPEGIFDRAAKNAVEKFKYKPRIVNGKPAMRRGVQFKMTFELDDR